jgi:hypothetical protein
MITSSCLIAARDAAENRALFVLDGFSHYFDDGDIVMLGFTSVFPSTLCWCPREAGHAAELFGQLTGQTLKRFRWKSSSQTVIERQEDLDEMHERRCDQPS